jgi:hypothetical protein
LNSLKCLRDKSGNPTFIVQPLSARHNLNISQNDKTSTQEFDALPNFPGRYTLNSKLNLGDVLQSVQNKLTVNCPENEPQDGKAPVYKPTDFYYIDKLETKIKNFYQNPDYENFSDNCYSAFFTISNQSLIKKEV